MIIAFSGNTSWSMYNFRLGLMKKFLDFGYEVYVVAPTDDYTKKIEAEGIKFIPITNLKRSGNNPIQDYSLYKEYAKIYKKLQPAFIFHYTIKPNIYGTLAARLCNIKSISITTGLGNAFAKRGIIFYFVKYLYKISSFYAVEVWFLNSSDKHTFIKNNIIPESKSFILPGEGINTSLFIPAKNYPVNEHTTFLLLSRMLYDKGIKVFVDATRLLLEKGYELSSLLLGQTDQDNPEAISRETIEKWQQEGVIKYLGSTANVKPFIENADAVVLPSYYKEGIPRVLLEAASMGKPIITTRNPGCIEVVDDGVNGYLCEIKNVNDMASKMEQFIHLSIEERKRMGMAGRRKMQANFDEQIVLDIYKKKCDQYTCHQVETLAAKALG